MSENFRTVDYNDKLDCLELIDQVLLPKSVSIMQCRNADEVAGAISDMHVRGAPAIGVTAAYGVYIGLRSMQAPVSNFTEAFDAVCSLLKSTRPTAVNLFWAVDRVKGAVLNAIPDDVTTLCQDELHKLSRIALSEAQKIMQEDISACKAIGRNGSTRIKNGQNWLTHCNAGALATAGYGTALGVFRAAWEAGKKFHVYVDETRPLLQGARLTAWELAQEGIPATLICDNMSAGLMAAGKIDGIVVGADRITLRGYTANKIGTYALAVMAQYHNIPFYVAAPRSTFDADIELGSEITIEQRNHDEIRHFGGVAVAPEGFPCFNPAFDITPPELISAFFTDAGILSPPFKQAITNMLSQEKRSK